MQEENKKIYCEGVDLKSLGDKKVIDLVIPMYKAKETLVRLLSSVATQSMRRNIHVILVQDCDKENYQDITNIFRDILEIEIIELEENSGPGKARRVGRKQGKCKYVMYMDSDDTFHNPFSAEALYTAIEGTQFDAINSVFLEQLDGLNFLPHREDWIWVFGKIYRREFLEKNNIEMNDSRANEDTGFNSIISTVGKIGFLEEATYIWHFKEDSITRRDGGIYRFTGIEGWLYNMQYAVDNIIRLKADEERIKKFVARNIMATYGWFLDFSKDTDERVDVEEYKKWVHKYYENIYTKYKPTKEQLEEAFAKHCEQTGFRSGIPLYTFEQYLYMVGEGYNE